MTGTNAPTADSAQLTDAFQLFNQFSAQLTASYGQLQAQVAQLTRQLAAARSERMRQLAERERLAHHMALLLDTLPAAVVVLDGADRIQQYNPAAAALLPGIDDEHHWPSLFQQLQRSPRGGGVYELASGRLISFTQRSLEPEEGRILLLLDVTETHRLQQRLERQERLSLMGEMAAQLAHQIRTPLTSSMLYNAHLARADLDPDQREAFAGRSLARLRHIEQQIEDMLAFARGGQYSTEAVDLRESVTELVQSLDALAGERQIRLRLNDECEQDTCLTTGNPSALLGALLNVGRNAVEHSPAGAEVAIRLQAPPGYWRITISDQGAGIPQSLAQRIFDPFFTTRNDGTGLGLAVAQSVVLAHRGRIELCPASRGGACFSILLPRAQHASKHAPGGEFLTAPPAPADETRSFV